MSEQAEEDKSRIVEPAEIAALRAENERLREYVQDLADDGCLDQEVCGETNLRLIDYCGPCRARAVLEKKP